MKCSADFLAVDLGASSGRVMVGQWDGNKFSLQELHRFPNGGIALNDSLYWDVLGIWSQMQVGFTKYRSSFQRSPAGIGIDGWGVDFGLLDRAGRLLGNPVHYRDARTDGIPGRVFARVPEETIFAETGVQSMQINTLFQIYSMLLSHDPQLSSAATLLGIPDLFLYFLSGVKSVEFTEATTMQMYSGIRNDWACGILEQLEIPLSILPSVLPPGTMVSTARNCGFENRVPAIAVATHDTASAVAAIPHLDSKSAFISSGTWSLMGVELPEPNISQDAMRLHFTNEGSASGAFLLLKNITGLWIIQQCIQHWILQGQNHSWEDVIDAAAKAEPFGAICDPNDKRLQVQMNMPDAIRAYCRNTGQPEPGTVGEFARFAFESLSLKYRSVLHSLELLTGRDLQTLRVVGGGSLNAFLCQMTADTCNRVVVSGPAEASAFGNVMLQAVATGHLPSLEAGRTSIADSTLCSTFNPHPGAAWDAAYARFKALEVD